MLNTANMYLNGPFAPWREEGAAFDLEVVGEIPKELNGALFRAGASQHYPPTRPERYHWFDGDGMIHGLFLRDGRAQYRNRLVRTAGLQMEMQEGRSLFGSAINGTGEPVDLQSGRPPFKNSANTNVIVFADRLLAFAEVDVPHELRADTLETVGLFDFGGTVSGPVTAHFKIDPANGDMLFFGVNGTHIIWYRADRNGTLLDTYKFDMGAPCFVHDFGVTANYAVFCVSPQMLQMDSLIQGNPSVVWDTDAIPTSRFAVMNRSTGDVTWIDTDDAFQLSHTYNAFEEGNTIVLDAHRTGVFGHLKTELGNQPANGDHNGWFTPLRTYPTRWIIDLGTRRVSDDRLTDISGDFPRVNDRHIGLKTRYNYMATIRDIGDWLTDGVAKHDVVSGRTEIKEIDGLTSPTEAVFVAREGATDEDDGWLLSIWWDPARDRSELLIQHAQDFTGTPVARVKLNHRVPMGFHGNWIPAAQLDVAVGRSA